MSKNSPLPRRLYEARKKIGISQRELGLRLGMEPNTASSRMNQYEKGQHAPDYLTLKRIADELNVIPGYFLIENDMTAELLLIISKLNKETKEKLISKYRETS